MHVHAPGVCAALHGQECMSNEYRIAGNFVGEQFLQISLIDYDSKNFFRKHFTIVKHMVHSQRLHKSLLLQLLIEQQMVGLGLLCILYYTVMSEQDQSFV